MFFASSLFYATGRVRLANAARAAVAALAGLLLATSAPLQAQPASPPPASAKAVASAVKAGAPAAKAKAAAHGARWRSCPGCDLAGHDFSNRVLERVNLLNANLAGANFAGATLRGVVLNGANLSGANFAGARIEGANKRPTSFLNADISQANFTAAKLLDADLQYANLSCTNFSQAALGGASFGVVQPAAAAAGAAVPACKTVFTGAQLNCRTAELGEAFDLSDAVRPACHAEPAPKAQASAAAVAATWSCPNTTLSTPSSFVYVAPTGQDGASCGLTASAPCQTLGQGLAQCTGAGCAVLALYGKYDLTSTLALASNKSIYGGCVSSGTASGTNVSIINAPPGGVPAVSASGVTQVLVQGFSIVGSNASGNTATASVAVSLSNQANVTLSNVSLTAGQGGAGATGTAGTSGARGGNGSGSTAGSNGSCNASGGNGGVGMTTHVDYNMTKVTNCPSNCASNNCNGYNGSTSGAGAGYGAGRPGAYCQLQCISSCPSLAGYTGGPGSNGSCGAGGKASTNISGGYANGNWAPSAGADGVAGQSGGGGGGGGGGAACGYVCFWVADNKSGGPGGGGGGGSCGATQGRGGQQGGASIAMQVVQSTVVLNTVTVVGSKGGTGGDGGANAAAVAGGSGGGGTKPSGASPVAGTGGSGGSGGWGGSSGAGAGGNGGPSYGITFVSTPQANVASTQIYPGGSGDVGQLGATAGNPSGAPCQSAAAIKGSPGTVNTYQSF